ncbi:hypothetical protein [Sphaerisporangium sp. TRM90804]|uniref:hypothetical protein n=1 Tax=Sphaerisporangium sp. TRM90804 TaxID=3031113 RepID=UPI00244BD17E|nr:hypothetical protein [Sphaerisporangium sp. TRM90804]MDH2425070.1 hypothetical protein [Sphaerisporangium sp. TRM90804]
MTALPVARTRDEAHLYLDLHPCPRCGSTGTVWQDALVSVDGALASRYTGTCGDCGEARGHLFGLPEREVVSPEFPAFGGPEPSQLLDAGEWLWVADLTAGNVPTGDPAAARRALAIAVAAVGEVVKFIPPGAEEVPATAFWSERGTRLRDSEPGRFQVDRLLVVRDAYRRLADRW